MTPHDVPEDRRDYLVARVDRACMDHLDYVLRDQLLDLMWRLPGQVSEALALEEVQMLAITDERFRAMVGMAARALGPQGDSPHLRVRLYQGPREVREQLFCSMVNLSVLHSQGYGTQVWEEIRHLPTRDRATLLVSMLLFLREHERADAVPGQSCALHGTGA